jgi:hypothetical protein
LEEAVISEGALVTVTKMKHIIEVQHMEKKNRTVHIQKIDADTYVEIATGEIKEFNHIENRKESLNSLRQTFKKMRYLINNNFSGQANEMHIVLTYREHVTDSKRLYSDFDKFFKRLKYRYKDKTSIDYLNVIEPQGSGRWHCHLLLRFNDLDSIFIPNKFDDAHKAFDAPLYDLWGQGWVTIKSLKGVDNIGAYLSAYLADVELDEKSEVGYHDIVHEKIVEGKKKKFLKGGRLHMYPPGMNLFRSSKGIKNPERIEMSFKEAKKIVGHREPHYSKSIKIKNDEFENTISYLQYNTKRVLDKESPVVQIKEIVVEKNRAEIKINEVLEAIKNGTSHNDSRILEVINNREKKDVGRRRNRGEIFAGLLETLSSYQFGEQREMEEWEQYESEKEHWEKFVGQFE